MIHDPEILAPEPQVVFELQVACSAPIWPGACNGVRNVLAAVQKMLEAAANGSESGFLDAKESMSNAAYDWQVDLFGAYGGDDPDVAPTEGA